MVTASRTDFNKIGRNYLGKVRSNFLGTEFGIFDSGENIKKAKFESQVRKQLGYIYYESNILGSKGPRKMRVYINYYYFIIIIIIIIIMMIIIIEYK